MKAKDIKFEEIAQNSRSPLSEVKEIFRAVENIDKVSEIIKAGEKFDVNPIKVVSILKAFKLC
jgi:hypothetical protein